MAGQKQPSSKLNFTLLTIILLLNKYKMKNWFIGYGTLLGIARNKSCVDNDDDIDIMVDKKNADEIKHILTKHGFKLRLDRHNFMNTFNTPTHAQIDFYLCDITNDDFNDTHSNILWKNCYPLKKGTFYLKNDDSHDVHQGELYLPNKYELKLKHRYGEDWRIPQSTKIPVGKRYVL